MSRNFTKYLIALLLIALLYIAYDKDSQSLKLGNVISFLKFQSADEGAIKEQLKKVYNEFFRGVYADNPTNLPFYNSDLSTSFAALFSPVFTMANSASFTPENIEVIKFIDSETAIVAYTLVASSNNGVKDFPIEMEMHKIGGIWLLDSENFLPKRDHNIVVESQSAEPKKEIPSESTFQQIKSEFNFFETECVIKGVVDTIIRYGEPNYGETPEIDKKLIVPVIKTVNEINIYGIKHEPNEEPAPEFSDYLKQTTFQLSSNDNLNNLMGKTIILKGSFFPGHTAHHHTDVLFQLEKIIDNNASN